MTDHGAAQLVRLDRWIQDHGRGPVAFRPAGLVNWLKETPANPWRWSDCMNHLIFDDPGDALMFMLRWF